MRMGSHCGSPFSWGSRCANGVTVIKEIKADKNKTGACWSDRSSVLFILFYLFDHRYAFVFAGRAIHLGAGDVLDGDEAEGDAAGGAALVWHAARDDEHVAFVEGERS